MPPTSLRHSAEPAPTDAIMSGPLRGFDVASVLQAVSHSREPTLLRLWGASKRTTGEILLKAGQLLDAIHDGDRGRSAFHAIVNSSEHHFFRVERANERMGATPPVGPVAVLLLQNPGNEGTQPVAHARPSRHRIRPVTSSFTPEDSTPGHRRLPIPASPALPPRLVAGWIEGEMAQRLTEAKAVEGALLVSLPGGQLFRSWNRSGPGVTPDKLATYVGRLAMSHQGCLTEMMPASGPPTFTVELPTATLVIEAVSEDLLAAYVFGSQTALGLLRLTVADIHPSLVRYCQTS